MADCWIEFKLTNDQRRCFALEQVEPGWKKRELKHSPYDLCDTFAYFSENILRKIICVGEGLYAEQSYQEEVSEDGRFLLPRTARGKPIPLTAANALKRTPVGMSLVYSNRAVSLTNLTAQRCFFYSSYIGLSLPAFSDFEAFVEAWCRETDAKRQADVDAFAQLPRIHQKYREGDFFRFRINRTLFGYGRILVDYDAMRKNKIPFWDIFMGKPLCVCVYRIATERTDCSVQELAVLPKLPSTMVMDNIFYYGECEIIGNKPLQPEDEEYPIHYGTSLSMGDNSLCYQCGKTFLTLPGGKALCNGFCNNGIGWRLNISLPILQDCIRQNSNLPYWSQEQYAPIRHDLRNPKYRPPAGAGVRPISHYLMHGPPLCIFFYPPHSLFREGCVMVMSYVWAVLLGGSVLCALITGRGQALSAGVMQGAQTGVTLAISIAGSLCLWAGVGRLMEKIGLTAALSSLLRPVLERLFPSTKDDRKLAGVLSANVCANILGLGNAATPPGIEAARRLAEGCGGKASDELCRLIVLNTASIQLIPANVAAIRSSLGCATPFDILPAVWAASLCSAGMGLTMAWLLGRIRHD